MTNHVNTERRSRRTHKNSKDGCPNCRSIRIKCSEELPVCANCIKKGLRCGYLDFPEERLEIIRHKHTCNTPRDAFDLSSYPAPFLPAYQLHMPVRPYTEEEFSGRTPNGNFEPGLSAEPLSPIYRQLQAEPVAAHLPARVMARPTPNQVMKPLRRGEKPGSHLSRHNKVSSVLRSEVYSRVFSHVASELTDSNWVSNLPEQLLKSAELGDWNFGNGFNYTELKTADTDPNMSADGLDQEHLSSIHFTDLGSQIIEEHATQGKTLIMGKLPNGIEIKKTFHCLQVPEYLKISFTPNKFLRKRKSLLSLAEIDTPMAMPIYSEHDSRNYWLNVFLMATRFDLFFQYFIDKSLNILIRASESVVNGDIITTSPKSIANGRAVGNSFPFFYNTCDLDTLTKMSYVSYGKLILELRQSILCFNPEYPAKMSLFSARACYMNPATDFETYSLMMSGTLTLFKNILLNALTQEMSERNIRHDIAMLNYYSMMAVCPDYNYEVIWDLKRSLQQFKIFVEHMVAKQAKGYQLDSGVDRVLKDSLFMHNCHELEKYLTKLETYYIPMLRQYNDHYNNIGLGPGDPAIRYTSASLIFDMMYEWFKIYSGERLLMGTAPHPLQKLIHLFFHALGKTLNHVLPPIKSVMFVDPCNIMFTKVGMQFSKSDHNEIRLFPDLVPVMASVYRTIHYFESRLMLYGYSMANETILDRQYLQSVAMLAPKDWEFRDIIRICPPKMRSETQVTRFSSGYFKVENFAFPDSLLTNATCAELIAQEANRQKNAIANEPFLFDFHLGFSNHDFNPELIIECYVNLQSEQLKKRGHIPVDREKLIVETLIQAHCEVDVARNIASYAQESNRKNTDQSNDYETLTPM